MVELVFRRVGPGAGMDLGAGPHPTAAVSAVRGRGRGSQLRIANGPLSLWFCLDGTLELDTTDGPFRLGRRQFLALPAGIATRALAREPADWAAIALPAPLATALAHGTGQGRATDPQLFPAALPIPRPLLRALLALHRASAAGTLADGAALVQMVLLSCVQAQQAQVGAWIERASGRSDRHRRQVVLRLLSARNRILNTPFDAHDLDTLAAAARYSKSHFLRMFRDVFGTTPHDMVIGARMDLAKHLIAHSDLAISEVAASVGYDSRFAFARLFKKRVGMTASDYRQDAPAELRQAA